MPLVVQITTKRPRGRGALLLLLFLLLMMMRLMVARAWFLLTTCDAPVSYRNCPPSIVLLHIHPISIRSCVDGRIPIMFIDNVWLHFRFSSCLVPVRSWFTVYGGGSPLCYLQCTGWIDRWMDGCTQSLLLNPNKEEIPGNYNPVIGPIRQETRACVPGGRYWDMRWESDIRRRVF